MKPRIFVSSTYYDLKYIRSNIERFINQYGFEPVLFESGNVFFEHDKELDISCYNEVKLCHMMILIIGGRYGAPNSEEKHTEFVREYEKKYISVTRKEFKEALNHKIPIFIFIEKNVYSEYQTFKRNQKVISHILDDSNSNFNFAFVDDINIFEFIDEVKVKAISTFEKFEEIESYLKSQWAGMFYNHLIDIKDKNRIINEVSELHSITERMNQMIDQVGKSILTKSGEYDSVVKMQHEKSLLFYTKKIVESIQFADLVWLDNKDKNKIFEVSEIFVDTVLNNEKVYDQDLNFIERDFIFSDLDEEIRNIFQIELKEIDKNLQIERIDLRNIYNVYSAKLRPLFDEKGLESLFKETLQRLLSDELLLPF